MTLEEKFNAVNLELINSYIETKQEENLQLDFKLINRSDLSHADDKKNYAKALSGFANSSGGILIWGIKASKNDEKIDCAQEKHEIENINLFLNKLNEFAGIAVQPIVDGIKNKVILTNENKGFAVTFVPESNVGPHMAKFREDRYYKRSGDSFYKMEHFDIADMFGKRRIPKLKVYYTIFQAGSTRFSGGQERLNYRISFGVKNVGRGSAHHIYFAYKKIDQFIVHDSPNRDIVSHFSSADPNWARHSGHANLVLHPGMSIDFSSIHSSFTASNYKRDDIKIEYELSAEGLQMDSGEMIVKWAEVLEKYPKLLQ